MSENQDIDGINLYNFAIHYDLWIIGGVLGFFSDHNLIEASDGISYTTPI